MTRIPVTTRKGAPPKGIYSQAMIAAGKQVYVSGQGPVDPESGDFCLESFGEQALLTFQNVTTLLAAAGTDWRHVVKVNIYLADLAHFGEMNAVYQQFVSEPYPARTTVQAGLGEIAIEVDCIAVVPEP